MKIPIYETFFTRIIVVFGLACILTFFRSLGPLASHSPENVYLQLGLIFFILFFIIQTIYVATIQLDQRSGWNSSIFRRTFLQIFFGVVVPFILGIIMLASSLYMLEVDSSETSAKADLLLSIFVVTILANLYYGIRYFFVTRRIDKNVNLREGIEKSERSGAGEAVEKGRLDILEGRIFTALTPTRTMHIPEDEIAYFYRVGVRVYVRLFSGQDYLLAQSLDAISSQLDQKYFFRVARHLIAHRDSIRNFQPLMHGKLRLSLYPNFREDITVSKLLARQFKIWIGEIV
ncbi:hypothetical protein COR50_18355 [Chitinophaga caeni]|uniref:HTH LytTR-type domain-containing protein n=1 Tax=Chitinophaga caeni TaxID=2029983 RepID=A0A291QYN6_9BACT|nr:LytTR family DNA-binding domain-containing protein [Chitinophaga caeni]ATL48973.1 hypothetical protein COR50_18355 [Chitinophaga caeni]